MIEIPTDTFTKLDMGLIICSHKPAEAHTQTCTHSVWLCAFKGCCHSVTVQWCCLNPCSHSKMKTPLRWHGAGLIFVFFFHLSFISTLHCLLSILLLLPNSVRLLLHHGCLSFSRLNPLLPFVPSGCHFVSLLSFCLPSSSFCFSAFYSAEILMRWRVSSVKVRAGQNNKIVHAIR